MSYKPPKEMTVVSINEIVQERICIGYKHCPVSSSREQMQYEETIRSPYIRHISGTGR